MKNGFDEQWVADIEGGVRVREVIVEKQTYKTNRWIAGIAILVAFLVIGFAVQLPIGKSRSDICLFAWMYEAARELFLHWESSAAALRMRILVCIMLFIWILVSVAIGWAVGKIPAFVSRKD